MKVAVMGAGLQGVCVALELAREGIEVILLDQDDAPLNRASLRNEGKIHLGIVYANDPSLKTPHAMLQGALQFSHHLNRWTAGAFDRLPRSKPFWYLIARDSLRSKDELFEYYETLQLLYENYLSDNPAFNYLGARPERIWMPLRDQDTQTMFSSDLIAAATATVESAINVNELNKLLRDVVAENPNITFLPRHRIEHVRRDESGFTLTGIQNGRQWIHQSDQVVNALWDGRLTIDKQMNMQPHREWVHRLKYRVLVDLPPALHSHPSVTYVLGAYGDVVVHPNGAGYVSWYPECMLGWSASETPPAAWEKPCRGETATGSANELSRKILTAADPWFPGLAQSKVLTVDAGVIFAWGKTDITDPDSELHTRSKAGVQSVDGYHTIDTGKLTTAPQFAVETAKRIGTRQSDPAINVLCS